ncbi:hypothetical protein XA39_12680 [Acinetobacter tandoii]|nr:hypothetical protein XA39_12680 [Acinetobacter tandoii]
MFGLKNQRLAMSLVTLTTLPMLCFANTPMDASGKARQGQGAVTTVTGPAGSIMPVGYAESVAAFAYVWGWPLVNMHNRQQVFTKVPKQLLLAGVMPAAPINHLTMLTDYVSPQMRDVAHPNQDVVYGFGILDLAKSPVIVQVPNFKNRFWTMMVEDQRTDSLAQLGSMHGTQSGFYMIVGPDWQGDKPAGVTNIFRSSTNLAVVAPRVFMQDTPEDRIAVQEPIAQIAVYPFADFDGTMKSTDWKSLPHVPDPNAGKTAGEKAWVKPETFFTDAQLGAVLKEVPPLAGEEALYQQFGELLKQAKAHPEIQQAITKVAQDVEKNVLPDLFRLENIGKRIAHGWAKPMNNGRFGTDYLTRLEVAKSNIFTNDYLETNYLYQYNDQNGQRINGNYEYTLTFAKGQTPPVVKNGFWSLTMYDHNHFFHQNEINRYSVGTKNKSLKYNADGSLTIYIQNQCPSGDKVSNWLPAPKDDIAMTIRAYAPAEALLNNTWQPPAVVKVE